jgi:hypothetical protein
MKGIMNKFNLPIKRCNSDGTKWDLYGRKLLDLCKYFSLIISNRRVGHDKEIGFATTVHNTVVDYFIGSPEFKNNVVDYEIEAFDPLFSDVHNKITYSVKCRTDSNLIDNNDNKVIGNTQARLWNINKQDEFINNLDIEKIESFIEKINNGIDIPIENCNKFLNKIMIDSADKTFCNPNKKQKRMEKVCIKLSRDYFICKQAHKVCVGQNELVLSRVEELAQI